MTAVSEPPPRVNLAHEPDFRLGGLLVQPSACRIVAADAEQRLEPRVMEVLVVLARAGGRTVTRDELIEACWEGRFVSDDAITRVIAKVRNLARSTDPPPFVLETVPKVGFRLTAADGEPEPRPASPDAGAPSPPVPIWRTRRFGLAAAALALLLAVAGGWAVWRSAGGGSDALPPGQNGRVEVVRFEPMRDDPALERLSAAVGDSVVRLLASTGVETSQRPVRRDEGGGGGAEFRIAGAVDREGDNYVVNAQIIERRSGLVLWSGRTERPIRGEAGFAEEAATRIASGIPCALEERGPGRRSVEPAVFGLFLNVCAAATSGDAPRMLDLTRRLAQAAPGHPGAHAMHAMAAANLANGTDFSPDEIEALRVTARESAERALKLEPNNAKAHTALAMAYGVGGNWRERERHFRTALRSDADVAPALFGYAYMLREVGRVNEAREKIARIIEAQPRISGASPDLALMLAANGDFAAAEAVVARVERISPDLARSVRFTIALWWEPLETARARVREFGPGAGRRAGQACAETHLERLVQARGAIVRGLPETCATMDLDWRIRMLARQGDLDGAYALMGTPLPNSRQVRYFLFYPEMKAFRADARFMTLAKRLGLVDYWLETNRWPDFCAEPDLPYDCRAAARATAAT